MTDDIQAQTTAPLPETAAPAPATEASVEPAPAAQEATAQPALDAAIAPLVASEPHYSHLHRLLLWLKTEFEALGMDIKAELEKL